MEAIVVMKAVASVVIGYLCARGSIAEYSRVRSMFGKTTRLNITAWTHPEGVALSSEVQGPLPDHIANAILRVAQESIVRAKNNTKGGQ